MQASSRRNQKARRLTRQLHQKSKLRLEQLERRDLLATWDGGGGADNRWDNALNWSGDVVPGIGDPVATFGSGTVSVVVDNSRNITTLQLNAGSDVTLTTSNGSTISSGAVNVTGTLRLGVNGSGDRVTGNSPINLNNGNLILVDSGATPGLIETVYNINNINDPFGAPVVGGPQIYNSVRAGETDTNAPWNFVGDNETIVYRGQIFVGAGETLSFAENIDDEVMIRIDGVQVLLNQQWDAPTTTGPLALSQGWHDIELRFMNGGGGAGPVGANGWTTTKGFGYSITGSTSNQGGDYQLLTDPGNATRLRQPPAPSNTNTAPITSTGTSSINVGGLGNVSFGTLNVAAGSTLNFTAPASGIIFFSGAGTIGAGANVNVASGRVNINGATTATGGLNKGGAGTFALAGGGSLVGTVNVTGGVLAAPAATAGNVTLNLNNGQFTVLPPVGAAAGGLLGDYFAGTASATTMLDPSPGNPNLINLELLTPQFNDVLTPRVDFGAGTEAAAGDGNTLDRGGSDGNVFGGIGLAIAADNVQGVWTGYINVPLTGAYTFTTRSDDGSRLWLDINDDGDFTDAGELVVDNNFFQGMTNRSGTVNNLASGLHRIRIAGYEGGGGAGFQASWSGPTFGRRIIEPGALYPSVPASPLANTIVNVTGVSGINAETPSVTFPTLNMAASSTLNVNGNVRFTGATTIAGNVTFGGGGTLALAGAINATAAATLTKNGGGRLELLSGANNYTGVTTINGGTVLAGANGALGTAAAGTTVNGGVLELGGTYPNTEALTLTNGGALVSAGNNTYGGSITVGTGGGRISSTSGTLTLPGAVDLGLAGLVIDGAGNVNITGQVTGAALAGLVETVYNVNNINNPTAGAIVGGPSTQLRIRGGETDTAAPWNFVGDNETIVYRGQFFDADGVVSFAENIDDDVMIRIDGVTVLFNQSWNTPTTTGILNLTPGWHDIEIRMANGGGGAGPTGNTDGAGGGIPGWSATKGFGVAINGSASLSGDAYTLLVDPGNASVLRQAGGLTKNGAGTLTLSNGSNNYVGATTINGGVLQVNANNALGAAGTGTTVNGGTLALGANYTTAEPLVLINGTLSSGGDFTYGGNIVTKGGARIVSTTGTLTLPGTLDIGQGVTFDGAGTTTVTGQVSGGVSAGLLETIYGVNNSGNPTAGAVIGGPTVYPRIRAGEWTADDGTVFGPWGFVGQNETIVYSGQFFDADGVVSFAEHIDDDTMIRINGVQVLFNQQWDVPTTTGVLSVKPGWNDIEIRFANGGGGAGPVGNNGWVGGVNNLMDDKGFGINVNGSTSNQGGDYQALVDPGNASVMRVVGNLTKVGTGTLVLANANNTYASHTFVNQGTLVVQGAGSLGATSMGTTVSTGATLGLSGGITLGAEPVTFSGTGATGQPGALVNISGNNTFNGSITAADVGAIGALGIGSVAGTLTINGNIDLKASHLSIGGAGDVIINGNVHSSNNVTVTGTPGLLEAYYDTNDINNPTNLVGTPTVFLNVRAAETTNTPPWTLGPNADDEVIVYTGQFFDADGIISFGENIDDQVMIRIDGQQVLLNTTWDQPSTTGVLNLTPGWHNLELRFQNGGGGAGPVGANGWTGTKGFGFNPNGTSSNQGGDYVLLTDPGNGSLLRTNLVNTAVANTITKTGAGNLILNGTSTVTGPINVNGGTLAGSGTVRGQVVVGPTGGIAGGAFGQPGTLTLSPQFAPTRLITTLQSSTGTFPVLNNDLLQTSLAGAPTVSGGGLNTGEGTSGNIGVLANGQFGTGNPFELAQTVAINNNTTLTYNLNLATNPRGYDIASIDVFSHWRDAGRDRQDYTIRYSTVAEPGVFRDLTTVNLFDPNPAPTGRATFTTSAGVIATGVAQIQFFFDGQENGYVGYTEIDVVGAPTASPSALVGAPIKTTQSSTGAMPVGSNDLLTGLTATVTGGGINTGEGTAGSAAILTNGQFGTGNPFELAQTVAINNNTTLTYNLNLGASPRGYDITSIDVFSHWRDAGRDRQDYTVRYATVASPGVFIEIGSFADFNPVPPPTGRSTVSAVNGALATGVGQIQFFFPGQENGYVGYTELDVYGVPTADASLTIGANGSLRPDFTATGTDLIRVNGTVTINSGASISANFVTIPAVGSRHVLIDNDGTDPIVGQFGGVPNGGTIQINGRNAIIYYDFNATTNTVGGGNDLAVVFLANPPTITFNPVANPSGNEGQPIDLGLDVVSLDTPATLTIEILNVPTDARITNAAGTTIGTFSGGIWTLTAAQAAEAHIVKDDNQPQGSPSGSFDLTIRATSTPTDTAFAPAVSTATRNVTVTNVAPIADITGTTFVARGQAAGFTLTGIDAPGDIAAGLTYFVTWGDGATTTIGPPASAGLGSVTASHEYGSIGTFTVTVRITDHDGAFDEATTTVTVSAIFVDPDTGDLVVGGTNGSDRIIVQGGAGGVQVRINNVLQPRMAPEAGGVVRIYGGQGNDTITVSTNVQFQTMIFGGPDNDYITGGTQSDTLSGDDGNDRVLGGGGNDTVMGGNGNDTLSGGAGNDTVLGDAYLDATFELQEGTGNDTMNGDVGNDTLDAGAGNDKVYGGTGHDVLFGRDGADRLDGGAGNDLLYGEAGSDSLYGMAGNDVAIGGSEADLIYGGDGSDLILGDGLSEFDAMDLWAAWTLGGIGNVQELRDTYVPLVELDDSPELMYGQNGNDWFLLFAIDRVKDGKSSDIQDRDLI